MSTTPTPPACVCHDPAIDQLRAMVAAGWDQRAASHFLWGDPARAVPPRAPVDEVGVHVRRFVRASFKASFPWLRLPPPRPTTTPRSAA